MASPEKHFNASKSGLNTSLKLSKLDRVIHPFRNMPLTLNRRRWLKFKSLKRGHISFVILVTLYVVSFFLPLIVSNKALMVHYNGSTYFPAFRNLAAATFHLPVTDFYSGEKFGQFGNTGEVNYRELQRQYATEEGTGNYVVMPLYQFGPLEDINDKNGVFVAPMTMDNNQLRLLGTDDRGRDVFARMAYGFNISISFALLLAFIEYIIGIPIGAALGYFGGKTDLIMQRFIEIWSSLPFLFLIIIIASIIQPSFGWLVILLSLFGWISITTYMRAEFYREKAKDYVAAAISIGVPTWKIMLKHILPNSLVPIITFFPFAIVAGITALVGLDFLGFGLPAPTPSWGQMMGVGLSNITKWWLVIVPLSAMFLTLLCTVFIGEGVREAFDPKVFSRLR
ncbi:MAG: ABC transporter permease subunit [Bacteroidota bacterium]